MCKSETESLATNTMESSSEHVDFVFGLLGYTNRFVFVKRDIATQSSLDLFDQLRTQHAEKATGQRE